jgi:AraC family transcriptional regulator
MRAPRESDVVGKGEVVLAAGRVVVGRFRCSLAHPLFHDSGPIENFLVVFPRNAVEITHAGGTPIVSDPTSAMLYNRGQEYRRAPISADGDRCDWFAFQREDMAEAVAAASARSPASEGRPLPVAQGPVDADLYLQQRRLFEEAASATPDALRVEDGAMLVLQRTVRAALRFAGAAPERQLDRSRRERVAAVQEAIATRFGDRLTLAAHARVAECSSFHLARIFRAQTGSTIHAHLTQLRLRAAMERLEPRTDLAGLSFDLGFSSHSHFTSAFRRAFGATPSAVRDRGRTVRSSIASPR